MVDIRMYYLVQELVAKMKSQLGEMHAIFPAVLWLEHFLPLFAVLAFQLFFLCITFSFVYHSVLWTFTPNVYIFFLLIAGEVWYKNACLRGLLEL